MDAEGHFAGANGSVRDMRERDRLEQDLRTSEERYRFLVDNSPDIIFSVGEDARFTYISESVRRALGREPSDLIGASFGAVIHYDDPAIQGRIFEGMRNDPTLEVLTRMVLKHADGRLIPFEVSAVGARVDGRFIGIHGAARDIGDRERLERDLRESESRYRTLASSSPDLVFATDAEGRYTFLSDRAASMLGWDLDVALGRRFMEYVAPGWEQAAVDSYRAIVSDPTVVHTSRVDFLRGNGETIPLEINVIGTVDNERLTAIHGVARDISERERLERELQRSEERYRFLIQNSPDVVFATDAEGRFTFASSAVERMTGYRPDELIGQPLDIVVDATSRALSAERWQALVDEPDRESQAILTLRGKDGRLSNADVRAIGVVLDGTFTGIQGSARDVSDQVRLERELRRQAGELASGEERAHLARELHDSVTQALFSMTLVSRSVEMLLEPDPEAARAQMGQLRDLQREALAEMRALIFELRPGNIEQDGLVRALKTHASALQGRVGLPILVESDLEARLPLEAEQVLYRVAQEALHNVVKHAAARQVRIDVHRDHAGVRLRIIDDGKGFDPEQVPDGHLGLAGMRARADRLGATFSCESRPGAGTTIEVTLAADALASIEDRARLVDDAARAIPVAESPSIRDG
jgi:PAS domain S-box-containing protein